MSEQTVHVASLDLCKILYRFSKWKETIWSWYCDEGADDEPVMNLSEPLKVVGGVGYFDHQYPAYDLSYLIRKFAGQGGIEVRYGDKGCIASSGIWVTDAPTPEDAVCKLCCIFWTHGLFK